jgi:2-desacetyl-2-hydroxyethyl bacteriochlorophyllide A dehydrogenase
MKRNPVIVFPEPGKAIITELDIPAPGPGEVLIKTLRTMVSIGTEMTAFCGKFPKGTNWEKFFSCPYYPGYNNIGIVVKTGPGVDKSFIGRKLATGNRHAAYVTENVAASMTADDLKAAGKIGFFEVPENLNDDHAVFFTIPEIVMNGIRSSGIKWGECAVVFGLGLLGQFAARFCRMSGAAPVFAVDISADRLAYLPQDPAVIGINPAEKEVLEVVKKHNHGRLADVIFEVTGNAVLLEKELPVLREKGRLLLLSSPKEKVAFDFQDYCAWPSYTIIGCHNFSHPAHPQADNPWTIKRHVELFFDLIGRNELDMENLISRRADYFSAPQVYNDLLQNRSKDMGIIFNWDKVK